MVIGAIGVYDTERFYKMTFRRNAPHLRIDPIWDFEGKTQKNSFAASNGGNSKIDIWISREFFGPGGWHLYKYPLWSNGKSTPRITAKRPISNTSFDAMTFRIMQNSKEELFRNDYFLNTLPANRVFYIYTKIKEKELVAMLESGGKPAKVCIRFIDKNGKCVLENIVNVPNLVTGRVVRQKRICALVLMSTKTE